MGNRKRVAVDPIDAEIARLQALKKAAEAEEWRNETLPKLKALVGKAFVYDSGSFRLIQAIVEHGSVAVAIFKEVRFDSSGAASIATQSQFVCEKLVGWEPCTTREFRREQAKVERELDKPKMAIEYEKTAASGVTNTF